MGRIPCSTLGFFPTTQTTATTSMPPPSASPVANSFFKSISDHPPPALLALLRRNTFIRRRQIRVLNSKRCPNVKPSCWRTEVVRPRGGGGPFEDGERRREAGGSRGAEGVGGGYERRRGGLAGMTMCRSTADPGRDVQQNDSDGVDADVALGNGRKPAMVAGTGMMTIPTVLTLGRVAAVPLLVSTFYLHAWWSTTATTSIFLVAAITDWLDGYIARKMRLGTAFGAFLDPVADKLMVAATLVMLCARPPEVSIFGQAPWILTVPSIAIIGREQTQPKPGLHKLLAD